jgi:hypothetical protein
MPHARVLADKSARSKRKLQTTFQFSRFTSLTHLGGTVLAPGAAPADDLVGDPVGEGPVIPMASEPVAIVAAPTAVAPIAAAAPKAIAKGKAKARGRGERVIGPAGGVWSSIDVLDYGKLVLNPYDMSYGAHCAEHGATCRINRVIKKRPIGYLVRWMQESYRFKTADAHKNAKYERADGEILDLEHRLASRDDFSALPGSREWLNREPAPGIGELLEPAKL